MKYRIFLPGLIIILALASAAISQTGAPERKVGTRPPVIRPTDNGKNVGKAPASPKELPDGKYSIIAVEYLDTLPGARVTIENVGGKTIGHERGPWMLGIRLLAIEKTNGSWPKHPAGVLWRDMKDITCPYSYPKKLTASPLGPKEKLPILRGVVSAPLLKGRQRVTVNVKFDRLGEEPVTMNSLVDFGAARKCGPHGLSDLKTWSDFKYLIRAMIFTPETPFPGQTHSTNITEHAYNSAYLHP